MQIEVDVVILCEWVEVRKVHLQQVLRLKGSERSHFAHNCLALTLQWVCQCWDMDFIHFDVEKSLSCKPYLTAGRADARLDRACPEFSKTRMISCLSAFTKHIVTLTKDLLQHTVT